MELKRSFGLFNDVLIYGHFLHNHQGTRVCVLELAGIVQEFSLQNQDSEQRINTVISFDNVTDYAKNPFQINKQIGRVAGRIAGAQFELNGKICHVEANEGRNALHGGSHGLSSTVFDVERIDTHHIRLHAYLKQAQDGYPNDLQLSIDYCLNDDNCLIIQYNATAIGDTVFDPTLHIYWQLPIDWSSCTLQIPHGEHIAVDAEKLPVQVDNQAFFDFRQPENMAKALAMCREKNNCATMGWDEIFRVPSDILQPTMILRVAGRYQMRLFSNRNGLVVFSASPTDCVAHDLGQFNALATEAQTLPNSLNRLEFGNIRLLDGQHHQSTLIFQLDNEGSK